LFIKFILTSFLSILFVFDAETAVANITDGLIAHYSFEGNLLDESGKGHDANQNGNINYVDGVEGTALQLNGDANVKTPIALNGTDENQFFTISFWGYAEDFNNDTFITNFNFGDGSGSVHISAKSIGIAGKFKEYVSNGYSLTCYPVDISKYIQLFTWTHYLFTYDNNIEKIYINGILKEQKNIGSNQVGGYNGCTNYPRYDSGSGLTCYRACFDRFLNIGMYNNAFGYSDSYLSKSKLKGKIDELRIYNRILLDSEIRVLSHGISINERNALIDLYYNTNGDKWSINTNWLGEYGTECKWFGVVCDDLQRIKALYLFSNNLEGIIPSSIQNLTNLQSLILHNNKISGTIPIEIYQLEKLESLTLNNNRLTNNIVTLTKQYIQECLTKWDVKNDNRIGIEEAINALKISSDISQ